MIELLDVVCIQVSIDTALCASKIKKTKTNLRFCFLRRIKKGSGATRENSAKRKTSSKEPKSKRGAISLPSIFSGYFTDIVEGARIFDIA